MELKELNYGIKNSVLQLTQFDYNIKIKIRN